MLRYIHYTIIKKAFFCLDFVIIRKYRYIGLTLRMIQHSKAINRLVVFIKIYSTLI